MVRPAEAVSVEWSEIDFDKKLWTIPAIKMKKTRQGQFPTTFVPAFIFNDGYSERIETYNR